MPYRKIDEGYKVTAMRLADRGRDSVEEITQLTSISPRTFYRIRKRWNNGLSVSSKKCVRPGRPRMLDTELSNDLVRWNATHPTHYLRQLRARVYMRSGMIQPSVSTIYRSLKRARITRKKVVRILSSATHSRRQTTSAASPNTPRISLFLLTNAQRMTERAFDTMDDRQQGSKCMSQGHLCVVLDTRCFLPSPSMAYLPTRL